MLDVFEVMLDYRVAGGQFEHRIRITVKLDSPPILKAFLSQRNHLTGYPVRNITSICYQQIRPCIRKSNSSSTTPPPPRPSSPPPARPFSAFQIGRASCRERV